MSFNFNGETPEEHTAMNKNYVLDTAKSLQYTKQLLKVIGIWPMVKRNPKRWENYLGKILIVTGFALMSFLQIPVSLHTIWKEKKTLEKVALFCPISFFLAGIFKYLFMIFRCETLKQCIKHVEIDWMAIGTENDREIMMRNMQGGRRITVLCGMFLYIGGALFHMILPLWRGSEINEFNETIRPQALPGYDIFFDVNTSPTYEITFGLVALSSCVLLTVMTTACNITAIFVSHVSGQIEVILSHFETFFEKIDATNEVRARRIGSVIKSHVRVLRLTSMIETLVSEICLVEVSTSIIIICLQEYCFLMAWNENETVAMFTYVVMFTSSTTNVFIFCYIGELLKGQCARIADVAYMMNWYRLSGKTGLALIMIIATANCPRKLTAGRMIELSVYSFGYIMRTSVAYLNMLRTTTG